MNKNIFLRSYLFKERLNMLSLIANQVKTNMRFNFIVHCSLLFSLLLWQLFTFNWYNNNCLFAIPCSQLFAGSLLSFKPFCSHAISHKADWILTDCLALLYTHVFSLQNVFKVEGSWSRLLENAIPCSQIFAGSLPFRSNRFIHTQFHTRLTEF